MRSYIESLSNSISEIIANSASTRRLTLSDYHLLTTVVKNEVLSEFERKSAQRAIYLVRRGRISLVDDISPHLMAA